MNRRTRPNFARRRPASKLRALLLSAGAAVALGTPAVADMLYWTGHGSTDSARNSASSPTAIFDYSYAQVLLPTWNGAPANADVWVNWVKAVNPGSTQVGYPETSFNFEGGHDVVFSDSLHSSRSARRFVEPFWRSMQITTRGDFNFVSDLPGDVSTNIETWLVRWPECSGQHVMKTSFNCPNLWLGGTGELQVLGKITGDMIKSGSGTLVFDPPHTLYDLWTSGSESWIYGNGRRACDAMLTVHGGTMILRGVGEVPLIGARNGDSLRVGREFGGQDAMPTNVPYPGWVTVPLNPSSPAPVISVERSSVVQNGARVRIGVDGTLRFNPPNAIGFGGEIISNNTSFGGRIRVDSGSTYLAVQSLPSFTGRIDINSGRLIVPGGINTTSTIVFGATNSPQQAVLELVGDTARTHALQTSGYGRVHKTGASPITLSAAVNPAYVGDFLVSEGELITSNVAGRTTLSGLVTVTQTGVLRSTADENIADGAQVRVEDTGRWLLRSFDETISQLVLLESGSVDIEAGGLLRTGGISATPGTAAAHMSVISGPGVIDASNQTLYVSVERGTTAVDLDMSAPVIPGGASGVIAKYGQGVLRIGGEGQGSAPIRVIGGDVHLNKTGATAATGALTVGDPDNSQPFLPAPRAILVNNNQIADTDVVHMVSRSNLVFGDFSDIIGGLDFAGVGPFSVMSTLSGNVQINGPVNAYSGAASVDALVNLGGGSRSFVVDAGATLALSGLFYNGTINKTGTGAMSIDNMLGSAILRAGGPNCTIGTATLGGMTGTQNVQINGGLTVDSGSGVTTSFGGALTGAGSFTKSGTGTMVFQDATHNSYAGETVVSGGVLAFNRPPNSVCVPHNLTVNGTGTVRYAAGASHQIADSSDVFIEQGGTMNQLGQSEVVRNMLVYGTLNTDATDGTAGQLGVSQTLFVLNGQATANMTGGQVQVIGTGTAKLRGTVSALTVTQPLSTLETGGFTMPSTLIVTGALAVNSPGATLGFTLGSSDDPAMVRVNGSMAAPTSGQIDVHVRVPGPVQTGKVYQLIEFAQGVTPPSISKFRLETVDGGRGVLRIQNNRLQYVHTHNECAPDSNGDGVVSVEDIFFFLNVWFAGQPQGDFNGVDGINVSDIFDFLSAWFAGC